MFRVHSAIRVEMDLVLYFAKSTVLLTKPCLHIWLLKIFQWPNYVLFILAEIGMEWLKNQKIICIICYALQCLKHSAFLKIRRLLVVLWLQKWFPLTSYINSMTLMHIKQIERSYLHTVFIWTIESLLAEKSVVKSVS